MALPSTSPKVVWCCMYVYVIDCISLIFFHVDLLVRSYYDLESFYFLIYKNRYVFLIAQMLCT